MASSIAGVPPRPLTISATGRPAAVLARRDEPAEDLVHQGVGRRQGDARQAGLAVDAQAHLDLALAQREAGLPRGRDGTGAHATPIVRTSEATARASAATSASERPASAAAPATLWTRIVPANPRRPACPAASASGDIIRHEDHLHGEPLARARSAARPKLRRSPV